MNSLNRNILLILLAGHVILALVLVGNRLSYSIFDGQDGCYMNWAYQESQGYPSYGQRDDPQYHNQNVYSPLIWQIHGMSFKFLPFDVRVMRFINFLFAAGCAIVGAMIALRMCGDRFMALIAGGLILAVPPLFWIVDAPPNQGVTFFALLGLYFLAREPKPSLKSVLYAVLALFASFWAKQTGIAFLFAGLVYVLGVDWRRGLAGVALAVGLIVSFVGYYAITYPGDLSHILLLASHQPLIWDRLWEPVLFPGILGRFSILLTVILIGVWSLHKWQFKELFRPEYLFLGAAGVIGTLAPLKYGSGEHQTILFYVLIVICGTAILKRLWEAKVVTQTVMTALLIMQMLLLIQDPRGHLFTETQQARFDELLRLVATPGRLVFYNDNPTLSLLVDKPFYSPPGREDTYFEGQIHRSRYPQEVLDFYNSDPFDMIIIDIPLEDGSWPIYERLNVSYRPVAELPALPGANIRINFKKVVFMRKDLLGQ